MGLKGSEGILSWVSRALRGSCRLDVPGSGAGRVVFLSKECGWLCRLQSLRVCCSSGAKELSFLPDYRPSEITFVWGTGKGWTRDL